MPPFANDHPSPARAFPLVNALRCPSVTLPSQQIGAPMLLAIFATLAALCTVFSAVSLTS